MRKLKSGKYFVVKRDPKTGELKEEDPKAQYFVLRLDTDPKARAAIREYAKQLIIAGEQNFAEELTEWVNNIPLPEVTPKIIIQGICPVCGADESQVQKKHDMVDGKEVVVDRLIICTNCGVIRKF